jgi:DNA polymerase-3 subunit alpha
MMDSVASTRKHNLDGQMGLFGMMEEDAASAIPIPKLPELKKADMMAMEKETTGIYLSGHPMDDYRQALKGTRVIPMGKLLAEDSGFADDQVVTVAGVIQSVKTKTTRNQTLMAYVTVEDDTGSMEMLAFSNALTQHGNLIRDNSPVVITGRLSLRDEKEPQILINRVQAISEFVRYAAAQMPKTPEQTAPAKRLPAPEPPPPEVLGMRLYLKLPSEESPLYPKVRAMLNMFPGSSTAVLFFDDTKTRRGTGYCPDPYLLQELKNVLGEGNVVLK